MSIRAKKEQLKTIPTYLDVIVPKTIRYNNTSMMLNEQYQTVLCITDYPPAVKASWLSEIANLSGVITSMHVTPTNALDAIDEINKSMRTLRVRIKTETEDLLKQRAEQQYKDAQTLIRKLDTEQQKLVDLTVIILITANSQEELMQKKKLVEAKISGKYMRSRVPTFRLKEAFNSVAPFMKLEKDIYDMAKRNMTAETVASSYPFVYSGINDGTGILLGKDRQGGIVLIDFWLREGSRTNSNLTVLGKPGMGKSTAIKKIIKSEIARGTKVIAIDPEREYKDMCKNLKRKGKWINCATGGINPFQIKSVPKDDEEEEEEERLYDAEKTSPLALHFQTLRIFFDTYLKGITLNQRSKLEFAIEATYEEKQIKWDTDPLTLKNTDYPIMEDLYNLLNTFAEKYDDKDYEVLAFALRSAAVGADRILWNGPTTIDADARFIVLDINNLLEGDERILSTQFFNILTWVWNEITLDRSERVLLISDETYILVDPENPKPLMFLRNTSKRIRKYEGALMVITHNMNDFMDPAVRRFGQALLDNPVYKLIMGQGDNDIKSLRSLMELTDQEVKVLKKGGRGQGLFVAGDRRVNISIEATAFELELFGKGGGR